MTLVAGVISSFIIVKGRHCVGCVGKVGHGDLTSERVEVGPIKAVGITGKLHNRFISVIGEVTISCCCLLSSLAMVKVTHTQGFTIVFFYPLVICYIAIENDHRNSGFSH